MKGVENMAQIAIVLAIILVMVSIHSYVQNNNIQAGIKLNFETLEVVKLKSTFSTFNRSLGMTWFISTVQSVFWTVDEKIGCGYDQNTLERGFWLMGRRDRARDFWPDNFTAFKAGTEKYNWFGANPQVCYPKDNHIVDYIKKKFYDGGYLGIKDSVEADGVQIGIVSPRLDVELSDADVNSTVIQDLTLTYQTGEIKKKTENKNAVYTLLKKFAESGRNAVESLIVLGSAFYDTSRIDLIYKPGGVTPDADEYMSTTGSLIRSAVITSNVHSDVKTDLFFTHMRLFAADPFFISPNPMGLFLTYNATIRYSEVGNATPPQNPLPWPTASKRITSCFGYREDPINEVGKAHGGLDIGSTPPGVSEPILSVAEGTVVDLYKLCVETSGPNCGKPGFGGYGNFVLIRHAEFYSFYAHLASVNVQVGQIVNAGDQIGMMGNTGRSTGIHLHLEVRKDGTAATRKDPCSYIDCSLSTEKQCTSLDTENVNMYYYYDDSGVFEKRPVTLEFNVNDYLPAIDCRAWARAAPRQAIFFTHTDSNDLACCGGYLFACGTDIENLPDEQSMTAGQSTNEDTDFPRNVCDGVLSPGHLNCEATGFRQG